MSNIGKQIRQARELRGWTQEELAHRMGYKSKSTVNKIEMGINDIPQSKVVQYAEVLGVTPAFLMGWEDEQNRNSAIVPLIAVLREDDTFLNLTEVFYEKKDKLQPLVSMMCADEVFFDMVWDLANLDDSQRASIGNLLSAFKQK